MAQCLLLWSCLFRLQGPGQDLAQPLTSLAVIILVPPRVFPCLHVARPRVPSVAAWSSSWGDRDSLALLGALRTCVLTLPPSLSPTSPLVLREPISPQPTFPAPGPCCLSPLPAYADQAVAATSLPQVSFLSVTDQGLLTLPHPTLLLRGPGSPRVAHTWVCSCNTHLQSPPCAWHIRRARGAAVVSADTTPVLSFPSSVTSALGLRPALGSGQRDSMCKDLAPGGSMVLSRNQNFPGEQEF